MLDLVKVGKPRQEYKDWKTQKFLSLEEYLSAAKKAISYFAPKLRQGLATEMLKNEDCISDVAYAMMKADWQYDPSKYDETKQRTQYSFRNYYALCAMQCYLTRMQRKSKKISNKNRSLNQKIEKFSDGNKYVELYAITVDKNVKEPFEILDEQENRQLLENQIKNSELSSKEEFCVNEYYINSRTYNDIANELNLTKERVRQIINKGMEKIRRLYVSVA